MNLNTNSSTYRSKYVIDLPTVGLILIVAHSFLLHLITRIFSGYVYAVLLFCFTVISILLKRRIILRKSKLSYIWLLSVIVLVLSYFHSQRSNGALLDVIVFGCGLLLILFCSENENVYLRCLSAIETFALFFAVGVLLQLFLPSLYRMAVALFPSAYKTALLSSTRGSGFTSNPGFSAGYIIVGLIAVISEFNYNSTIRLKNLLKPSLLLVTLLLTGKRGPTMFFVLTIIFCYLSPVRGSKKIRRYWNLFLIVFVVIILLWALRDVLSAIPIIGRFLDTAVRFIEGKDITSGRSRLYIWALELFRRNPLFGIGWGRFRTTVIGNVTLAKELETHNIYLQLLAETGSIGFLSFIATFASFLNTTRIEYSKCVNKNEDGTLKWRRLLFFSFAYQIYFLLYGLTGNPLYDPHFQIMYILSCIIIVAYKNYQHSMQLI